MKGRGGEEGKGAAGTLVFDDIMSILGDENRLLLPFGVHHFTALLY